MSPKHGASIFVLFLVDLLTIAKQLYMVKNSEQTIFPSSRELLTLLGMEEKQNGCPMIKVYDLKMQFTLVARCWNTKLLHCQCPFATFSRMNIGVHLIRNPFYDLPLTVCIEHWIFSHPHPDMRTREHTREVTL